MRFLYAKLVGYIGLYNGLGVKEIEIDFTKSQNKICTITGPNGCGKSTLLNALNILPDGNENFVPSLPASKQLRIFDEGTVYDIFINHPLDGKGNRAVTKVSIQKNGIELNPNGNVSSYKDIIFNEFDLDSNFITLTHLSGDDRGLADKKPAERKKFLASITSSLEAYNGIYKNLNKKGNVYKSYLTSLTGKISNVGDENSLRTAMTGLNNRHTSLTNQLEEVKAQIIKQQTIASLNDPNGELHKQYSTLGQQLELAESEYSKAKSFFDLYYKNNKICDPDINSITKKLSEQTTMKEEHDKALSLNMTSMTVLGNDIKNINENIEKDKIRISKLEQEVRPDLSIELEKTKDKLESIKYNFKEIGLNDPSEITSDNIQQVIQILKNFIDCLDYIYEYLDENELPKFIEVLNSGETIQSIIDKNADFRKQFESELQLYNKQYEKLNEDFETISELDKRPTKCKIDSCPFLSKSMEIKKAYKNGKADIISGLEMVNKNIKDTEENIRNNIKYGEDLRKYLPMSLSLDKVTAAIELNLTLFNKIGIITPLTDFETIRSRISRGDRFNEYRNNKALMYLSNDIIEYKNISKVYENLLAEFKANQSNIESLAEYKSDLESQSKLLEEKYSEKNSLLKDKEFIQSILNRTENTITILNELLSRKNSELESEIKLSSIRLEYSNLQKQFEGSADVIKKIDELQGTLSSIQAELEPIDSQKKEIESRLLLLENYRKEYTEYSEKYELINILKKHSSPTAGGIQTFFMNLYMGKTLELANQLLGMIFQGQYQLLEYVITADEFRMPFVGSGLVVDDITSGSTSQVCIMGMIINLSLLNQASTRYNITRLDEIDGGLDYNNRSVFMQILQRVIDILGIEQLFIISHNMEAYNGGTDCIQLAPIDGVDNANGSNVIYHY